MNNMIEPFLHYLNQLQAIMQREDITEDLLAQRLCLICSHYISRCPRQPHCHCDAAVLYLIKR